MRQTQTKFGTVTLREFGKGPAGLVALHGFTQHGGSFEELASLLDVGVVAVDLPGHGGTDAVPVTYAVAVEIVTVVLETLSAPPALLGYSQGGRIALQAALSRPDLVSRLILVSASPGIEDLRGQLDRRSSDESLAGRIEAQGVSRFIDEWLSMEMFSGLKLRSDGWRTVDRARRLENTAVGLAAALRGMGQGAQPYLGDDLGRLAVPLLAVAGGADPKYVDLAGLIADAAPDAAVEVIPAVGHAVIGEAPETFANLIRPLISGEPA